MNIMLFTNKIKCQRKPRLNAMDFKRRLTPLNTKKFFIQFKRHQTQKKPYF